MVKKLLLVLVLSFLVSCGKSNFQEQPGEKVSFSCKNFSCEVTTPNGTWYKPETKNLTQEFLKQDEEAGILLRMSRTPGETESKLANELAKEKGLSYFYINFFLVSASDLGGELSAEKAAKVIKDEKARKEELEGLKKDLSNAQKVSSVDTKIANYPAWVVELKGNDSTMKDTPVHIKSAYIFKGRYLFNIQGLCLETDKDKFFADFDKMLASFKIKQS